MKIETELNSNSGYAVLVNQPKLNSSMEKLKISDWNVVIDCSFSFKPSKADWTKRTVTIRPFNFWSYLSVGTSIEKRNERIPKLLAHELRHAQQKPPKNLSEGIPIFVIHNYWQHPLEVDARTWAVQHQNEFSYIITIAR